LKLDGLEEGFQSVSEATPWPGQWSATQTMEDVERTTLDRFAGVEIPFHYFRPFSASSINTCVLGCSRPIEGTA